MQENNNFQSIISQWRRLSGELVESRSTALISMSGDSQHSTKKEDDNEKDLLVPSRLPDLPAAVAGASATASMVEPSVVIAQPEKQELISPDKEKEEFKEASPTHKNEKVDSTDYLVHNDSMDKSTDSKWDQDGGGKGDKVDSVYLRPPPPHKARSNTSTPAAAEDEDCGIKCLYYTLQCCDCVLM